MTLPPDSDEIDLPFDFVLDSFFYKAEGIDVFYLRSGSEFFLAFGRTGYVCIATHGAFGHVAIGNIEITNDGMQGFQISHGFFGGAQIGFETISSSGVPARFKSMPVIPWKSSWRIFLRPPNVRG